jgi:hypothetical protein
MVDGNIEVYTGYTHGAATKTPLQIVLARDTASGPHHKTLEGFGPAILEKSSWSRAVSRGREQMLIEHFRSLGIADPTQINGSGPRNSNTDLYVAAARRVYGEIPATVNEAYIRGLYEALNPGR